LKDLKITKRYFKHNVIQHSSLGLEPQPHTIQILLRASNSTIAFSPLSCNTHCGIHIFYNHVFSQTIVQDLDRDSSIHFDTNKRLLPG
jgi:hypothetical protein